MKKLVCFLTFSLLFSAADAQQKEISKIDSIMQLAFQRGVFNGNVCVAWKGKVIYQKAIGYADGSKTRLLDLSMKFDIGSISKEFNGTAIMLLCEQGKLSINDSLTKFFPEFPVWARRVKIRHLINYTSGLPVLGPAADSTDALIYQSLLKLNTLAAEPGKVYIYNHANVSLQRLIIEKVSGKSYTDFVEEYLLKPAGMKAAKVDYPVNAPGMARAFDENGHNTPYLQGTKGWIRLPVSDLYNWIKALNTNKIISAQSFKLLAQNFPGGESSLGTVVYENEKPIGHQHQGSNSNYEAAYYSNVSEDIVIILMTNNQQMKVWPLKTAILNALHQESVVVPKKSLYLTIRDKMLANVEEGLKYYHTLKVTGQEQYDFNFEIGDLISTGKYLQRRAKFAEAIRIYETAVLLQAMPKDLSYGYELIGECYQLTGNKEKAIMNYQNAIKLDPGNKNAAEKIKQVKDTKNE